MCKQVMLLQQLLKEGVWNKRKSVKISYKIGTGKSFFDFSDKPSLQDLIVIPVKPRPPLHFDLPYNILLLSKYFASFPT